MNCQAPPHLRDRLVVARYWRDLIEVKAFVLVAPEQPGQPLRTELLAVLIPGDS